MKSLRRLLSRIMGQRSTHEDLVTDQYGNNKCKIEQKQDICKEKVKDSQGIITDQSDDQSKDVELYGDHETQLVETSEAVLHKYVIGCSKNPGHKEFIPVGTFSIKHLPEGLRDKDLYKVIKAAADLTIRVGVRMTSPNRPEFWPKTRIPYPFYDKKNAKTLRAGSGMINLARKFTNGVNDYFGGIFKPWKNSKNCWCKNCEGSDSPSNVWWEFYVVTAAHVVFDDIEASHTSLRLFFDSDDSPVVIVNKVSVVDVNIEHDRCRLNCVTCDKNLGTKVQKMMNHYLDLRGNIKAKYRKLRDVFKLTFIVSHPHGCSKQISVGQWKDDYQLNEFKEIKKFTYTTCTCPGSSGAPVHCVGYETVGWWSIDLVHSGCIKSGLNQSAAGIVY